MKLSSSEVIHILRDAGVKKAFSRNYWCGVHLLDLFFHTTGKGKVHDAWQESVKALPGELKTRSGSVYYPKWRESSGDCENISLWAISDVQKMNAATAVRRRKKREGIAVMAIAYEAQSRAEDQTSGGHCIVAYINHQKKLKVLEPQTGEELDLKEKEIESIWFVLAA